MLSDLQFDRARRLALRLAGIELVERHRDLLERRSRRLGILDSAGMDTLLSTAEAGDTKATQQLLSLLTTKFTGFFRHPGQFDVAAQHAQRAARLRGQVRLWSAAAATGEEPYSLAMALIERFDPDAPPATILATDIDQEALAMARRGQFPERTLEGLAPERRTRFFTETGVSGSWAIATAVSRLVEFRAVNLAEVDWPVEGPFDVIFCRNVLMYLEASRRCAALERMASLLASDGVLLQDPAEHLGPAGYLFTPKADAAYMPRRGDGPQCGAREASIGGVLTTREL